MKKIYVKPITEQVKVKLSCGVLDIGFGEHSERTDISLGKENNLLFDDEGDFGDLWDDGDSSSNPYDLWGEN